MAIKHKIKKYFDTIINPKQMKLDIMNHSIGKTPILQGLTGVVSGGTPKDDRQPAGVNGIDRQLTQPLP